MLKPEDLTLELVVAASAVVASTDRDATYVWRSQYPRPYATHAPPPVLYVAVDDLDDALWPLRERLIGFGLGAGLVSEPIAG